MTWFGLVILNTRSCLSIETDNSRNLGESSKLINEKWPLVFILVLKGIQFGQRIFERMPLTITIIFFVLVVFEMTGQNCGSTSQITHKVGERSA